MEFIKRMCFVLMLVPQLALAQQEYMVTHYMFNGLGLNPAYAGAHDALSTSFLAREQWAGFEGAPSTQLASVHSPIGQRPISVGAVLYRDKLGISSEYGGYFSYAYRIQLGNGYKLSMGLQASVHNYAVEYALANSGINDDEGFTNVNQFMWNVGTGIMLHSDRAYIGISSPQLLNRELMLNNEGGEFSEVVRHYYMTAGYAFNMGLDYVLKPNILVKSVPGAPVQVDLNMNLLIKSVVWVGASYRSMDSLDGLLGVQVNPQLTISYATDFTLSEIDVQSHEIMINYVIPSKNKKISTPRYF